MSVHVYLIYFVVCLFSLHKCFSCIVSQPESVTFDVVNASAVTVSWSVSLVFFAELEYIGFYTATGAIMSRYEIVLQPGVASTDVAVERDITLSGSKEDVEHNFTLVYTIIFQGTKSYGKVTEATFTFGMT